MDIYGQALKEEFEGIKSETLWLHNSYDEPEIMPTDIFFRGAEDMPELELIALQHCRGHVLDVGAGTGSHALLLQQNKDLDVTALDNSHEACKIMRLRGVKNVIETNFPDPTIGKFDTLLFMMNGIGITGSIKGLQKFLKEARSYLNPGGQLLFDSSDISYLFEQGIEMPLNHYYGEVQYQYEYKFNKGNWFKWIFVDQHTLHKVAQETGWKMSLLHEDENDQYLVRLT